MKTFMRVVMTALGFALWLAACYPSPNDAPLSPAPDAQVVDAGVDAFGDAADAGPD